MTDLVTDAALRARATYWRHLGDTARAAAAPSAASLAAWRAVVAGVSLGTERTELTSRSNDGQHHGPYGVGGSQWDR